MNRISIAIITMASLTSCGKKSEQTTPIKKDVTEYVFASGILEAENTYNLTAQNDGYLKNVLFKEGDIIAEGNILASIDNKENILNTESAKDLYDIAESNTKSTAPALLQASNNIDISKDKLGQDKLQFERYRELWNKNSIARIDFENAELQYNTSKKNYENAIETYNQLKQQSEQQLISAKATKNINRVIVNKNEIKALVGGKVFKKYKQAGDFVKKGDIIATIGNADFIYAKVNIDESNIDKIKLGQEAIIQLNTNKGKIYKGKVIEIYPQFDDATQSFFCKLLFTDTLDFKITGTQLQSNINVGVTKNALLIPRNFLDYSGNVIVKGKKEPVKVVTKFISNNWVQILNGIDENTVLVTENLSVNKTTTSEVGSQFK